MGLTNGREEIKVKDDIMSESTKYIARIPTQHISEHRTEAAAIKALKRAQRELVTDEGSVTLLCQSGSYQSRTVVYPVAGRTWSN